VVAALVRFNESLEQRICFESLNLRCRSALMQSRNQAIIKAGDKEYCSDKTDQQ
jgi:hypothetical protein